jgi:Uma2 family endonuclease
LAANPIDRPRHFYTLEEYFALEHTGQARYEYWNGEIVCMSGGSRKHTRISGNVYYALRQQITERDCEAFTSDLPIRTPALPPYRYPDASVTCGKALFEKVEGIDTLINPILIVEVLSPASEIRDRREKRNAYNALSSLMEYLLIAQDTPHITHFIREAESWVRSDYGDLTGAVNLPSIGCMLTLREIYHGVEFE